MFDNLGVALQLVKAGNLKLVAVASPQRMASLPNVPAIAEVLPGFASVTWYAVVAPPRTPAAIVDKVNAGINAALHDSEVQKRLAELSAEPVGGTPQATVDYLKQETGRWKNVITAAHVTLD
jgi:tripartite-type tricarboxylate transporter receptor subunit TctC